VTVSAHTHGIKGDLVDPSVLMEGTVFDCVFCCFLAGVWQGGTLAENLRHLCESSSSSAVSSCEKGTGALGRLSDRISMAKWSASVISWHVSIAIN
jgi:hypothetical protein